MCVCVQVEVPQVDRLLAELEELSCSSDHPLSYTSAAKCYAGLVNKTPPGNCPGGWESGPCGLSSRVLNV